MWHDPEEYDTENENWRQIRDYEEREEKKRFLARKREELMEQGLSEDEIATQIDGYDEVIWTSADWEDQYGEDMENWPQD